MRYVSQLFQFRFDHYKESPSWLGDHVRAIPANLLRFLEKIKLTGITPGMEAHERSKIIIFNYLNFFQFITGILVPVIGFFYTRNVPIMAWVLAVAPAFISLVVLILNSRQLYRHALLTYFILYPFLTCVGYINGINLGVELSFVLYGILSVFFIRDIGYMVFSIGFSMISYFVLSVILTTYPYQLEKINFIVYLINQALAIIYIFYGLYLIKTENANFNTTLQETNQEMQQQSKLLQQQAEELQQVNALKNKLFSIISHDLKAPMYALRNLFDNIQSQNMPGGEIKALIPDIKKDLNYTVGLMENLLQWSKSQMQAENALPQAIPLKEMTQEVVQVLNLQAEAKHIQIENKVGDPTHVWADRDMINLVLRNLISNAIKFTPEGGSVFIGANEMPSYTEIYIQDSGKGISSHDMQKINGQEFFTTNGTAQEQGTGLGLILCKEFLAKNDSQLRIETDPGRGSVFSFTLPKAE